MANFPVSNALTVANEILKIAKRKGISLTPMQIVKLTYIAHGWSLAILDRGLFENRIEAWKYGPVIPALYQATKKFGRGIIPSSLIQENDPSPFEGEVNRFLEDIVEKYGKLSGIDLSNLTHREGSPWHQVFQSGVMNVPISDEIIKSHYRKMLNEYQSSASPQ